MTSLDMFIQGAFLLAPEVVFNKSKSWTTGQLLNLGRTNSMGKLQGIGSKDICNPSWLHGRTFRTLDKKQPLSKIHD